MAHHRQADPVGRAERVEWARVRVEDAARLVVRSAHDDSLKAALASRLSELDAVRAAK